MATPSPAIADYPLFRRTVGDLNAERSRLITKIKTLAFRESELEQQNARLDAQLQELIAGNQHLSNRLSARRLKQPQVSGPARALSAPTADSLTIQLKAEKDPRERFRIQKRIDALSM